MLADASGVFLIVASICAVALSLLIGAAVLVLISAANAARRLIGRLAAEVEEVSRIRKQTTFRLRFSRRWIELFAQAVFRRFIK